MGSFASVCVCVLTESDWGESVYPVVYPEEAADTTDHRLPLRSISDLHRPQETIRDSVYTNVCV